MLSHHPNGALTHLQGVSVGPWHCSILSREGVRTIPGPIQTAEAWIQQCLYFLSEGGRAVVLVPSSFLIQGGRTGQFRQTLVDQGCIEAVFSLPAAVGPDRKTAQSILVLVKRPIAANPASTSLLLVDVGSDGGENRSQAFDVEGTTQWVDAYRGWKEMDIVPPTCVVVNAGRIAERDYFLSPALYLDLTGRQVDLAQMLRDRESVVARLEQQLVVAARADEAVKETFQWQL
jgi:type I restriction-modification system DNA methylase subunit